MRIFPVLPTGHAVCSCLSLRANSSSYCLWALVCTSTKTISNPQVIQVPLSPPHTPCLRPYSNPAVPECSFPLTGNHSKSFRSLNYTCHSTTCRNTQQPWKVVDKHFENFKARQGSGYTNLEIASASTCLQKELKNMILGSSENTGLFLSLPSDNKHYSIKVFLSVMKYGHKLLEPGNT